MPAIIVQIIVAVVLSLASYMLSRKKQQSNNVKAQDLSTPTVDAGRSIPVVFGRVRVKSPNLLWMGGNRSEAIKK